MVLILQERKGSNLTTLVKTAMANATLALRIKYGGIRVMHMDQQVARTTMELSGISSLTAPAFLGEFQALHRVNYGKKQNAKTH
jgi:hypothetical protein